MDFVKSHLNELIAAWIGVAVIVFLAEFFITAPYGRHTGETKGWKLPAGVAWFVMEALSPILIALQFIIGSNKNIVAICFLLMWETHYIHRAFIYPLRIHQSKPMLASIALSGAFFNLINANLNGLQLFVWGPAYEISHLKSPKFIIGFFIMAFSFVTNIKSDTILINLRKNDSNDKKNDDKQKTQHKYKIPYGGFFKYVSCPNYMSEMGEWIGFAIATWTLAGATFAIWTFANLFPRAISNHKWYLKTFPEYKSLNRKAVIPFIW